MYSQYVPTISVKDPIPLRSYPYDSTQSSTRIQTLNKQSKEERICKLAESITCKICLKQGKNPHICPRCQQMYCDGCIRQWLGQSQTCPNCHNTLKKQQLVNCSRIYKQITNAIQTVKQVDICKKHNLQISYYCKTCDIPVCSDCAVVDQQQLHRTHIIDKISLIVTKRQQSIKSQLSQLNNKKKAMKKHLQEIQQQMIAVKQLREQKHHQLEEFKKNLQESIERKHKDITEKNQIIKCHLQEKRKALKLVCDSVASKLNNYSKSKFLFEQQNILREVSESALLREQISDQEQQQKIETTIVSELVPVYDSKTFFIRNYTSLRKRKQIVYTQIFFSRGLEWRLKIYPNGSEGEQHDTHISIFVELMKGLIQGRIYKYKIQIINQKNREKKLMRQYESVFETGQIWGYNTYTKISTLYEQNYVHPQQDYLQIVIHIKSPSFYAQVLDQQKLIQNKKKAIQQNKKKIKMLKQELKKQGGSSKDGSNSFISLDDICEIQGYNRTPPDSPQIEDRQIYAPVIKPRY